MITLFDGQTGQIVIWIPSGGTELDGTPTIASQLRITSAMEVFLAAANAAQRKMVFLFSGEETLNCGLGAQAPKLARWFVNNHHRSVRPKVVSSPLSFIDVIAKHGDELAEQFEVVLVHNDWYMSSALWQLARRHPPLAAKVTSVLVSALTDEEYRDRYGPDYIAAYNAAAWLKAALGAVGPWHFGWFCLNQLVGKPSRNPVKRALRWLAGRFLRNDLTGK
jgi:hypothetical protein